MKFPFNYPANPLAVSFFLFLLLVFPATAQVQIWGSSQSGGDDQIGTLFKVLDDGTAYTQASTFMNNPEGTAPRAALAETAAGFLIGATSSGGLNDAGTLFKIENGVFSKLADLDPMIHGSNIKTNVLNLGNGEFLTATSAGAGASGGALLKFDETGNVEVIYDFESPVTGSSCSGNLAFDDENGIIYGVCTNGGENAGGTAFRHVLNSDIFSVIHSFSSATDGSSPEGGLILADDGLLYGAAQFGGNLNQGTLFRINPFGNVFELLYELNSSTSDGRYPRARLTEAEPGLFLGTCSEGGNSGTGTIFSLTDSGVFTRLQSLSSAANGGFPKSGLTDGEDGFYYGVTEFGAGNGFGSFYRIDLEGNFSVLRNFQYTVDGANPVGGLILLANGDIAGTSSSGGANNFGTVFTYDGSSFEKTHDFSLPLEGANPNGMILSGMDFYGVTAAGGQFNTGVFYTSGLDGEKTSLHDFNGDVDGQNPNAEIIEPEEGLFYGTARFGGANTAGTVYSITSNGDFELIHTFDGAANGQFPYSGVTLHSDGNLYGTTNSGGVNGDGIIYRITENGDFEKLHDFFGFFDGGNTEAGLAEGADGLLYGLAIEGGNFNGGTLFQFDPVGLTLNVMHQFSPANDGSAPIGDLLLHSDGKFYGTTTENGNNGAGTVFRYDVTNGFELLHSFDPFADGSFVSGGLAEDETGAVHGFCIQGGGFGGGTSFKYSDLDGFQKVFDFSFANSQGPSGTPVVFSPECFDDGDCITSEPCSVGICNFGFCDEVAINPVFSAVEIGLCEIGLDQFDMLVTLTMDASPGGILTIEGNEFNLTSGTTTYSFEVTGLVADGGTIDLNYAFEATGCTGTTGVLGTAPIPCPPIETTFRVDVSNTDVVFEGMHVAGNFQGWNPSENPMSEVETDIWEITIEVGSGEYEFNFFNGSSLFDGEYVIGDCANNGKRELMVAGESQLIEFCWETCFADCDFLGTNEDDAVSFNLYPNPISSGDDLMISIPSSGGNWNYFIVDITGRMIKSGQLESNSSVNSTGFAPGIYHIYLKSQNSHTRAEKFMVR